MTITYLGSLEVGATIAGATAAMQAGVAGMQTGLAALSAQIAAMQSFAPAPISFDAQLALAEQMVASVTLAQAAGLQPPSLTAQIAIVVAQIEAVVAQVEAVQIGLDAMLALVAPLSAAGVAAYAYDGRRDAFGDELDAAIGAGSAHANGLAYVTTDPSTWSAMGLIFKVSP